MEFKDSSIGIGACIEIIVG